jgi:hypothetical protein
LAPSSAEPQQRVDYTHLIIIISGLCSPLFINGIWMSRKPLGFLIIQPILYKSHLDAEMEDNNPGEGIHLFSFLNPMPRNGGKQRIMRRMKT